MRKSWALIAGIRRGESRGVLNLVVAIYLRRRERKRPYRLIALKGPIKRGGRRENH